MGFADRSWKRFCSWTNGKYYKVRKRTFKRKLKERDRREIERNCHEHENPDDHADD